MLTYSYLLIFPKVLNRGSKIVCKIIIQLILILPAVLAIGQTRYHDLIKKADSLYNIKEYNYSAITYESAFKQKHKDIKKNDLYNAACSWSLVPNVDSAFYYLTLTAKKFHYADLDHINSDNDLTRLYSDPKWPTIISMVKANKLAIENKKNEKLIKYLDDIYTSDQYYRSMIDSIETKFGVNSIEKKELFKTMVKVDSVNLNKVELLIKKHGWLGNDVVGDRGNKTIWLVIQHSNLQTQKKYLPQLRRSVKKGLSRPYYLALMVDRIAMNSGKKQIYGSQFVQDNQTGKYSIYPIEDEIHVNERRKSVGLPRLEEDAKSYGIDYKIPNNM